MWLVRDTKLKVWETTSPDPATLALRSTSKRSLSCRRWSVRKSRLTWSCWSRARWRSSRWRGPLIHLERNSSVMCCHAYYRSLAVAPRWRGWLSSPTATRSRRWQRRGWVWRISVSSHWARRRGTWGLWPTKAPPSLPSQGESRRMSSWSITIHNILRNEFTPLHLAAFTGDVDKASIILEQIGRQEVDCPGFGEVTALHVAVMKVRIIFVN